MATWRLFSSTRPNNRPQAPHQHSNLGCVSAQPGLPKRKASGTNALFESLLSVPKICRRPRSLSKVKPATSCAVPLSILQNASYFYPSLSRFYPIIYIPLYENLHFFHRSYTLLKSAAPPCIWPAVLYKLEAETEALLDPSFSGSEVDNWEI